MISVTSIINTPQTIDSVALPAFATQKRASATAAIIAASAARTVYYNELKGDAPNFVTEYEYTPLTGTTVALPDDAQMVRLRHAADIAALTVNPPANPIDQQVMTLFSEQAVTTLTMTGLNSQTILGALTALTDNGTASWRYEKASNKWVRL
jgi:hypothetical protein